MILFLPRHEASKRESFTMQFGYVLIEVDEWNGGSPWLNHQDLLCAFPFLLSVLPLWLVCCSSRSSIVTTALLLRVCIFEMLIMTWKQLHV